MRVAAVWSAGLFLASTLAGAAAADGFFYAPAPRWAFDPHEDLDFDSKVCPAIKRECPKLASGDIDLSVAYDELYDAHGQLAGLRMVRGSGCAPLDESLLLGQREFRAKFHKDGEPDLDDVEIELGEGVDPAKVRIVKHHDNLQFSAGCSRE